MQGSCLGKSAGLSVVVEALGNPRAQLLHATVEYLTTSQFRLQVPVFVD